MYSNMLLRDLLEVLSPVDVKSIFLLPHLVEPLRVCLDALFEPLFIRIVVLIASLYNLFVMIGVAHVDVTVQLVRRLRRCTTCRVRFVY